MDEVNNNVETKQPVVESLEPVVESLNDEPVETIDSSASVAPATVEPTTEGQVGFLEINSEANTGAPEVAAPEVIKSADSAPDVIPAVEPASEPVTEPVTEAKKEEPPKALETKKNDNKKVNPLLIVLILVLIAVGVAAGFFIAKSLGGKEINKPGSSGSPSNVNTVSIDKIVYNGLTFDIPKSFSATISDNMLSIEDSNGVNYAITIDDSTLDNNTVTIRDRDSMEQVTIDIEDLKHYIEERIKF